MHCQQGCTASAAGKSAFDVESLNEDLAGPDVDSSSWSRPRTNQPSQSGNGPAEGSSLEFLQCDWARPKPAKRPSAAQKFLSKRLRLRAPQSPVPLPRAPPLPTPCESASEFAREHPPPRSSPLLRSLERFEQVRNLALDENGSSSLRYPRSSDGWVATLCVLKGRALDRIALPFALAVGHAAAYACVQQLAHPEWVRAGSSSSPVPWSDVLLGFVLNSTLIFMLVFRLNRAADRFWTARALWGTLVAEGRTLVGGLVVHCDGGSSVSGGVMPEPLRHRDHAVRWTLAFFLAAMESLRGRRVLDGDMFAGILLQHEVLSLQGSVHMPLYCVHRIRRHLRLLCWSQHQGGDCCGAGEAGLLVARATAASRTLASLEAKLDAMMDACGGAERIRATPLPIVYVTHLRTLLLLTLLLLPYIYGPAWQWSTVGVVALAAFVWLGIEGAAREVENPFGYRVNDLPMDGYCKGMMATTIQELRLAEADESRDHAAHRNATQKL